jgi:phi13 family phage major tail protein
MAKVGLKYPVCALYDESTGSATYTSGRVIAKLISCDVSIESNNVELYADDAIDESDKSFNKGTASINVNDLTTDVQAYLLGHTVNQATGEMTCNSTDAAPFLGYGFYGRVIKGGVSRYRAVWLKKVKFAEFNDTTNTQGETIEFQTPTVEATIYRDIKGDWKEENTFDNEADAIAYLNGKAGIPVTDSAGLTNLVMTGTGATLAPTFDTGVRYYTFETLTGTSFTVTATAANHTIKLYVDDTYVQDLTSGTESNAIAMATAGTKKVKIVAYETGKKSQSTEIIVVK